jgi:tetraacyldisaccharide 4'-kinase
MRAPDFWWQKPGLAGTLLYPLSLLYGAITTARMARKGGRAAVPVICVGNPTVGGAGKTPTALAVAAMLKEAGERPFFLTRGYGGRLSGPLTVDLQEHTAADVGDEPLLLARKFPTVVARDRMAGAHIAAHEGASVIVMDDGFQNPSLRKDFSILVIDGGLGLGNGWVFPAGPLRAPIDQQLEFAQCIVAVGERTATSIPSNSGVPEFPARLMPDASASTLAGKKVLAFAGIGHPQKFFATLRNAGADVAEERVFDDHHFYSAQDAGALLQAAKAKSLQLVTTEKDFVRIQGHQPLKTLADATITLPVQLKFSSENEFRELLSQALARARANLSA